MATKLTITIPDELAAELKPWRDRMNISKTCAAAIEAKISTLAGLPDGSNGLTHLDFVGLVSRLRAEKRQLHEADYQAGYTRGLQVAEGCTYSDFLYYGELATSGRAVAFEDLTDDDREELSYGLQDGTVTDAQAYARGLVDGLMVVWDKVRTKI
jgi:hypothetical protein